MYKINYAVQNYAWGQDSNESKVYHLLKANGISNANPSLPYAELWLGTHVSGPSIIETSKKNLGTLLNENPELLGEKSVEMFGKKLPFLMKVLSVKTALSIQVHPNKKEAVFLHKIAPDIYKDDNHKPELAIALTDFEALAGFRKLDEITMFINSIPQLSELIGDVKTSYLGLINEEQKRAALKVCYKSLMMACPDAVRGAVASLVEDFRVNGKTEKYLTSRHMALADLFLRLHDQYPFDVGCFSVFLLNKVDLKPGEAIFLSANLPHAYLSGTIIECMACSDNVIRAGLTPKHKDVETLLNMVSYRSFEVEELKFLSRPQLTINSCVTIELYQPPVHDFAVDKIVASPSPVMHEVGEPLDSCALLLIIEGKGEICIEIDGQFITKLPYSCGNSFFVSAHSQLFIQPASYSTIFRAFTNVSPQS